MALGSTPSAQCSVCRMPLFLFNVSDRRLHGVFRAATDGSWELNPSGAGCRRAG